MRLVLRLCPMRNETLIPLNYQYPLSAAIYKILRQASPDYAAFLHDQGYQAPSGRLMQLFTFSKLLNPFARLREGMLLSHKGYWTLQIGSPMLDDFVQNFVMGLFESAETPVS